MKKDVSRIAAVDQAVTGKAVPQGRTRRENSPDKRSSGYRHRQQIYFELKVENDTGWREDVKMLQAGKVYQLSLRALSSEDTNGTQKKLVIPGRFKLRLRAVPLERTLPVICHLKEDERTYEEIFKLEVWEFAIPDECPAGTLKLYLDYRSLVDDVQVLDIASCTLTILSQGTLVDRELIDIYQLDIQVPDNVAVMTVVSYVASQRSFKLRGWNSPIAGQEAGFEELVRYEEDVNVALLVREMLQSKTLPRSVLSPIRRFSRNALSDKSGSFKKWLLALHKHFAEELNLIVYDTTGLEIPWELIELADWKYLGAEVKVVRGIGPRMHRAGPRLPVQDNLCEGKTLAYFDQSLDIDEIYSEREWLERLTLPYTELPKLENGLWYAKLKETGLIYVGGHGTDGTKLFGGQKTLLEKDLEMLDTLSWLEGPIVFFNVCESGRILYDSAEHNSFAEIFLRSCARGFIGTLGKVGNDEASRIAQHMLKLAVTNEKGVSIAELLRMLRQKVVREFAALRDGYDRSELEREEYERRILYTFLYVYYGNPLTRLRLYPAQKQEEV